MTERLVTEFWLPACSSMDPELSKEDSSIGSIRWLVAAWPQLTGLRGGPKRIAFLRVGMGRFIWSPLGMCSWRSKRNATLLTHWGMPHSVLPMGLCYEPHPLPPVPKIPKVLTTNKLIQLASEDRCELFMVLVSPLTVNIYICFPPEILMHLIATQNPWAVL